MRRALALTLLMLPLAACGSSSPSRTTTTAAAPGSLHVVVTAQSHHPVLGHTWTYQVTVTANGKPVACRIHVQVFFNGAPVGEVGIHTVKNGLWKETIPAKGKDAFPPAALGQHVVWHATATAKGYRAGSAGYPITAVR